MDTAKQQEIIKGSLMSGVISGVINGVAQYFSLKDKAYIALTEVVRFSGTLNS